MAYEGIALLFAVCCYQLHIRDDAAEHRQHLEVHAATGGHGL